MKENNVYTYTPGSLIHIVLASSLVSFFISVNEYLLEGLTETTLLLFTISVSSLLAGIFCKGERIRDVFILILYYNIGILAYISWAGGGLSDFAIMIFPAIIMLAALIGHRVHTAMIYALTASALIYLGHSTINAYNPNTPDEISHQKVFGVMALFIFTAYVAFSFSNSYKSALRLLSKENKKSRYMKLKLEEMARRDDLTGLLNRSAASSEFSQLLNDTNFNENNLLFYFIDLDNFKLVNDNYNHSIGDQLLIEVASRVKKTTFDEDHVCRLGGDEFVVIAVRNKEDSGKEFAANLLQAVTTPFSLFSWEIDITASIGFAIAPQDGTRFEELSRKADLAMYSAKNNGRNTVCRYTAELSSQAQRQHQILNSLQTAIAKQALEIFFQPTINLKTGQIESARALIQWRNENPHKASPDEFIPIIENSENVEELGEWLLREVCQCCKKWQLAGHPDMRVAIRMSATQLAKSNFTEMIRQVLSDAGLPASCLEIELKEHLLLGETGVVPPQLHELKQLGVLLTIDNFATGYSNLGKLTHLQLDSLKLDRSFTREFSHSHEHLVVVKAILSMAQILGLKSIAEAVDSGWQLQLLKSLGCEYAQGDLWGTALTHQQVLQLLNKSLTQTGSGMNPATDSVEPCPWYSAAAH